MKNINSVLVFLLGSISLIASHFLTSCCLADIKLPKCFSDSMVVQRNEQFPVWGEAEPNEELTLVVQRDGKEINKVKTTSNQEGFWSVNFPALNVGNPYTLSVQGKDSSVLVRDIVAGDIWLCSGQSNMEWPINRLPNKKEIIRRIQENKNLRILQINRTASRKPLTNITSVKSWQVSGPKNAAEYSAVATFFGSQLQQKTQVPIGLVISSWGGSSCEAWISQKTMEGEPKLAPLVKFQKGLTKGQSNRRMSQLYNGMIAPINRLKIRGVIWYQGESNVGRGSQYQVLFRKLIEDWRKEFGNEKLPFHFIQLAPFRYKNRPVSALAELWDAQLRTYKSVPNTGMIVITDLGNPSDIHPTEKKPVGHRLANFIFQEVYQNVGPLVPFNEKTAESPENNSAPKEPNKTEGPSAEPVKQEITKNVVVYSGPIFKSCQTTKGKIEIDFFLVDGILRSSDQKPLREFLIAGKDKKFHSADAKIVGNRVVVSSKEVPEPVAVRYCWNDTPKGNLVGSSGLPASPFRTDDFPLLSDGKDY